MTSDVLATPRERLPRNRLLVQLALLHGIFPRQHQRHMQFRFGEGEELACLPNTSPLQSIVAKTNCSSISSVVSTKGPLEGCADDKWQEAVPPTPAPRSPHQSKYKYRADRLRRQVIILGVELTRLRLAESRLVTPASNCASASKWKAIVMTQLQARQRAEHNNKVLKRMLTGQQLLVKSILNGRVDLLQAVLELRRVLEDSPFHESKNE
ncbi:hypothetical protein F444_01027 [Phytophthora nicotianae P1976]|uniref:Uncharacterized protein n=1 Tax=Phytophthora nicotianae P1976 TaxID=1317066 RepID=A0A081B1V4_PHYNI|nr:hypothetical protein F444_01027 [Phytophthora nicotianae P1976]